MTNRASNLKAVTLALAFCISPVIGHAASPGLVMPTIGASARPAAPAPSLGVNTTLRPAPNLAPTYRPSTLPAAPAPAAAAPLPTYTVPLTKGYAVVGAQPAPGNPGQQITVSPTKIPVPVGNNQAPQSAYGASVTVPIGTLSPKR